MDPTYLTTATTNFGIAEWVFFIAACAALGGGVYLALLRADANAIRQQSLRLIGYALLAAGVSGILIGLIRLIGVAIAPFWFTIATVLLVAVGLYAAYVLLVQLPPRLAAAQQRNRPSSRPATAQRMNTQGSSNGEVAKEPGLASGRRQSRRERKRRGK
jgi:hypothetical protein